MAVDYLVVGHKAARAICESFTTICSHLIRWVVNIAPIPEFLVFVREQVVLRVEGEEPAAFQRVARVHRGHADVGQAFT